jgi:hypothetical protein
LEAAVIDRRLPTGLAALEPVLEVFEEMEDCLAVLDAGRAGGPIDVLVVGFGFIPALDTRAFDGVLVRELEALEDMMPLVGDLVGDWGTSGQLPCSHLDNKTIRVVV